MLDEKEERIRTEAYRRWEMEGRPHGEHDRHWQEAAKAVETGPANGALESEATTQAAKVLKVVKPKAPKAAAPVAEAVVAGSKRTRAKKADV